MQVVSKLVTRVLTTIICLGYGIARPHLTWSEVLLVSGISLCYLISTGALEITHLTNQSEGDETPPPVWEILAIATDGCFAGWIFSSLTLTRKTLQATGQVYYIKFHFLQIYLMTLFFSMHFQDCQISDV